MVLATDHRWALRGWLRLHGIQANELAGVRIVGNLDGLLGLSEFICDVEVPSRRLRSMRAAISGPEECRSHRDVRAGGPRTGRVFPRMFPCVFSRSFSAASPQVRSRTSGCPRGDLNPHALLGH